jgi:S-formylglutathione hydrolase FrmB
MRSNLMKRFVNFRASLPLEKLDIPGFPQHESHENLKTIYLLHGFTSDCDEWACGSAIDFYAIKYNCAVIMPNGENSFYLDDPKRDAYYAEFIAKELVEFTRAAFPLSKKREDTLIGGLSMGGFGALRNGLKYHDVFGGVIALSSALISDEVARMTPENGNPMASYDYYAHTFGAPATLLGSDNDPKGLAARLVKEKAVLPRIYMACGTEDFLIEPNRDMHRHLEDLGVEHTYVEGPGVHDMQFWNAYIDKGLDWYINN